MLRIVFLVVILTNLLFFVWAQGLLGPQDDGREPQRLAHQIVPERLQVNVIDPTPSTSMSQAESCRLIKGLAQNDAQRLLTQLEAPNLRFTMLADEPPPKVYWVYVPPQQYRLAAEKKLAELKKIGVVNAAVILEDGTDKYAISLGSFTAEQLANDYLQELARRGVRSARIQMRESPQDKAQLEVRGPAELLAKQLPQLLDGQAAASIGDCVSGDSHEH